LSLETASKILETAEKLFKKYGIRSVTMDDIAREISISKKTIYQAFKDKNEIVKSVIERLIERESRDVQEIADNAKDAIEATLKLADYITTYHSDLNPAFMYDIEKYYPEACLIHKKYIENKVFHYVKSNMNRGVKEGLYIAECNYDILARLQISQIIMIFNEDLFPLKEYSLVEVHLETIGHFLRGILTKKGFEIFEKYNNETKTLHYR